MYRCAFLGCGPRAGRHAAAYHLGVEGGDLTAVCDLDANRRQAFAEKWGVGAQYDDFATMVREVEPHLVHIVTLPGLRVPLLTQAVELGVPAVIVEKPLALDLDDLAAIAALDGRGTRIIVNHQLRFHKQFNMLLGDVAAGRIGELLYVDGSCASRPTEQGSHVMNLLFALNGQARPVMVVGGVAGTDGFATGHPAPDNAWAHITFENGVRASWVCGVAAPKAPVDNHWHHKRAAAYGSAGYVSWWMNSWDRQLAGQPAEHGAFDYTSEDDPAQAALTKAALDWLSDDSQPHPNRLEISVAEAEVIMACYAAAALRQPIELPLAADCGAMLPRLRELLAG